jgi:hypothetical protein
MITWTRASLVFLAIVCVHFYFRGAKLGISC